ncbi:MAG: GDSL-type esterase/lipase family protein [Candidatus Accumulibacter sp.]|jgi:acyl-CoA hydrolase|nr:GDSL-type esterase/lipase family protein [Accumulibacter sp.]
MKRRDFVLFGISGIALAACGGRRKLDALPPGSRVLAFGDSVTHGTGAGPGEDWPTLLGESTGWRIVNAGVPGDTAEAGRHRIRPLLDEHGPALVIIEIGGNDFLRQRQEDAVKQDLRALIEDARSSGAQVVLIGVPSFSLLAVFTGKAKDSALYGELGKEENVPVIADVFSDVLSRPELCADRIHPNSAGYRQMAAGIHSALKRLGLAP